MACFKPPSSPLIMSVSFCAYSQSTPSEGGGCPPMAGALSRGLWANTPGGAPYFPSEHMSIFVHSNIGMSYSALDRPHAFRFAQRGKYFCHGYIAFFEACLATWELEPSRATARTAGGFKRCSQIGSRRFAASSENSPPFKGEGAGRGERTNGQLLSRCTNMLVVDQEDMAATSPAPKPP